MWGKKKNDQELSDLKQEKKDIEKQKKVLEEEVLKLKKELNELKSKRKIEEEEIKHLSKIKDEKREIEFQKKKMGIEDEARRDVMGVKLEYQNKIESYLKEQVEKQERMYGEILQRLPNVAVRLKGDV